MVRLSTDIGKKWLVLAITITGLAGLVYLVGQQNFRQEANDPQIQLAEDVAAALTAGAQPQDILPQGGTDIATSLTPYIILYSSEGKPTLGTGHLHATLPDLPSGVFDYAKSYGEDRFTWQPETAVRSAVVLKYYQTASSSSGYVMAGRSLREVEKRESTLTLQVFLAWAALMLVTTFIIFVG